MIELSEPTVTILLPTYNRAHFLPEAINSVLAQTYPHFRLIILDDASPDDTPAVSASFLADPRVRYVRHAANRGITGNWRAGIEMVETEFFCFLEDDDRFHPDFLERLMTPLCEDRERILSFCDHWAIDAEGRRDHALTESMSRRFGRHRLREGQVANFAFLAVIEGSIGITATLFRSAYVTPGFIRDEASGGIDYWLLYQCARTDRAAFYVADRLMEYRLHGAGMSHAMPERMAVGHLFLYEQILQDPTAARLHADARRILHDVATSYAIHLLTEGRGDSARAHLARALQVGDSARARLTYALASRPRGQRIAHILRQIKQRATARVLAPITQRAFAALSLLPRLISHLPHRQSPHG